MRILSWYEISLTYHVLFLNDYKNLILYEMLMDNDHKWKAFRLYVFADVPMRKERKMQNYFKKSHHILFLQSNFVFENIQTTRLKFNRNVFPQKSQANGFVIVPLWYSKCLFKLILLRNDLPHWWHLCWYSVCLLRCSFSPFLILNL